MTAAHPAKPPTMKLSPSESGILDGAAAGTSGVDAATAGAAFEDIEKGDEKKRTSKMQIGQPGWRPES